MARLQGTGKLHENNIDLPRKIDEGIYIARSWRGVRRTFGQQRLWSPLLDICCVDKKLLLWKDDGTAARPMTGGCGTAGEGWAFGSVVDVDRRVKKIWLLVSSLDSTIVRLGSFYF
jgi:hypothetical protein